MAAQYPYFQIQNQKHTQQGEDGLWYVRARFGPFKTKEEAKFARLHLAPNYVTGNSLMLGANRIRFERDLDDADINAKNLSVEIGPNMQLDMEPLGRVYTAWDPFCRRWWSFKTTVGKGGEPFLKGWSEYNRAHHLRSGDRIQFVSALDALYQPFLVVQAVRASPGSTYFQLPFENVF